MILSQESILVPFSLLPLMEEGYPLGSLQRHLCLSNILLGGQA